MRDSACATWRFEIYGDSVNFAFLRFEVKGKDRILIERYLHSKSPWLAALYNLGSGSWLARANDAAAQIAANVRVNVQLDSRHAASKHTTAPINRTRPSPSKLSPDGTARARKHTSDYILLLSLSTSKHSTALVNISSLHPWSSAVEILFWA